MATCPAGHESTTDDYCDTCGAPITAAASATSTASGAPPTSAGGNGTPTASPTRATAPGGAGAPATGAGVAGEPAGEAGAGVAGDPAAGVGIAGDPAAGAGVAGDPAAGAGVAGDPGAGAGVAGEQVGEAGAGANCPGCGDIVVGRFCESCGYDMESGEAPKPAAVTLILSADRAHWDRMVGSGEPAFPPAVPTLTLELTGDRATLGRVRAGATADVDLALTGAAADPGVSHYQCEFERKPDNGAWVVRDSGSSNGTWINDADEPLAAGEEHILTEGDRILVGAWTCLTVHLASPMPSS